LQTDDTSCPAVTLQLIGCADFSDLAAEAGLQLEGTMPITRCLRKVQLTLRHIIANTGGILLVTPYQQLALSRNAQQVSACRH
jgi:hypothetical protein